jgi:hypothetical protein
LAAPINNSKRTNLRINWYVSYGLINCCRPSLLVNLMEELVPLAPIETCRQHRDDFKGTAAEYWRHTIRHPTSRLRERENERIRKKYTLSGKPCCGRALPYEILSLDRRDPPLSERGNRWRATQTF